MVHSSAQTGYSQDAQAQTYASSRPDYPPALANWLVQALKQSNFAVDWVNDGRLVAPSLQATRYDALVLDLGLPGRDGRDVLDGLRDAGERIPVLVLTARDSLMDRVDTLKAGADDFLAKPFALPELEARLVALVRRARGNEHARFACGPLVYEPVSQQLLLRLLKLLQPNLLLLHLLPPLQTKVMLHLLLLQKSYLKKA